MLKKSRSYCFTWNNYSEDEWEGCKRNNCVYLVMGREKCPSTGTKHIQGYIYFKNAITFKSMNKMFNGAHITQANGTAEDNFKYCSKEGEFYEQGERPKQGKRTDLAGIRDNVKEGCNMRDVLNECTNFQATRIAEVMLKYFERERYFKTEVLWFFGETGCGKTTEAVRRMDGESIYWCSFGKWWEGYDAHENVIIDDIREETFYFHTLLRITDRYPLRVECKGGSRQLLARKIIITCPVHPTILYKGWDKNDQLTRRISEIREFNGNDVNGTEVGGNNNPSSVSEICLDDGGP